MYVCVGGGLTVRPQAWRCLKWRVSTAGPSPCDVGGGGVNMPFATMGVGAASQSIMRRSCSWKGLAGREEDKDDHPPSPFSASRGQSLLKACAPSAPTPTHCTHAH